MAPHTRYLIFSLLLLVFASVSTAEPVSEMDMIKQKFAHTESYKKMMEMIEPMKKSVRITNPVMLKAVRTLSRRNTLKTAVRKLLHTSKKGVAVKSTAKQSHIKNVVREGEASPGDDSDDVFNVCTLNVQGLLGGIIEDDETFPAIVACIDDGDEDCFATPFFLLSIFIRDVEVLTALAECKNGVEVLTEATEDLFDDCETPEVKCDFEDSSCTCAANPNFDFEQCLGSITEETGIAFFEAAIVALETCGSVIF